MKQEVLGKRAPSFSILETVIINPIVNGETIRLQFELRENKEITVIGGINSITSFFELDIVEKIENGYKLGIKRDDDVKRNPKSYKYFINICNYKKEVVYALKKHFRLPQSENIYFYRPNIFLMDEKETIEFIKKRKSYNNFNKFVKNTINRQILFHKMLNIPYKLNYNIFTLIKIKLL